MDNPNGSGQSTGKSSAAEIGRAACRERGEISGGGGLFKKKKKGYWGGVVNGRVTTRMTPTAERGELRCMRGVSTPREWSSVRVSRLSHIGSPFARECARVE